MATKIYLQRAEAGFRLVRGEVVRRLQVALTAAGSDTKGTDGVFGGNTFTALQSFQKKDNLEVNGKLDGATWAKLFKSPPPSIFDRCLQLTADFEGQGFQKLVGNFDGAGLTWGIIGFTLMHGEIQKILTEVNRQHPGMLEDAFGPLASELHRVLAMSRQDQLDWGSDISLGKNRYKVKPEWEQAFDRLGTYPEVQAIQLVRVKTYWERGIKDANRFNLKAERGVALCFDIAVQNGGIDDREASRIEKLMQQKAQLDEPDKRRIIADVVAENSRSQYVEDVRQRKRTIAAGMGTVHGNKYATADWGLDESLWNA